MPHQGTVERRVSLLVAAGLLLPAASFGQTTEERRLESCREVLTEVVGIPEGLSLGLLQKAECVAIFPSVKKAAIGIGGRFGKGAVTCRTRDGAGPWGAPLMLSLRGGSVGFQIGGQASDFVLLIMNRKGVDYLLRSKFTLGADASVSAGPKGRTAEAGTDIRFQAEILSYSRSRGLFAGLSLEGASIRQDRKANRNLYGEDIAPRALLLDHKHKLPAAAGPLVKTLRKLAPARKR